MNDDDRPSQRGNVRVRRPLTKATRGCATRPSPLSLSLSLFRARTTTTTKKYRRREEKIYIYIKISFEFKKITPSAQGERASPAQIISPPDIISSSSSSFSSLQSRARNSTKKKERTFIGAAGIFAPLKDDDLFADDEDGARIVASGWTVSVEDNILYMCVFLCSVE